MKTSPLYAGVQAATRNRSQKTRLNIVHLLNVLRAIQSEKLNSQELDQRFQTAEPLPTSFAENILHREPPEGLLICPGISLLPATQQISAIQLILFLVHQQSQD
jgi:hypothetical protein